MLRISSWLLLGFVTFSLRAQQTLSLEQAVSLALDGPASLEIQLAHAEVSQAQAQVAGAHALLLPTLSVGATEQNQARNLNAEGFRFANLPGFRIPAQVGPYSTFDARMSATQNLFNASVFARQKVFRLNMRSRKLTEEQTRQSVAAKVARAYLDVLRKKTLVEAAQADVHLADNKVSITRQKLTAGKAIPAEVAFAQSQLATVKIQELSQQAEYAKAKLTLLQLCNLEFTTRFEPVALAPWTTVATPKPQTVRPDLASAASQVDSALTADRALRWERLPTVSAYADAGVLGGVETHTVAVSVNLPLFDGGRLAARREEGRSILLQEQIRLKQLQQKAQLELKEAEIEIESANGRLALAQQNKAALEEERQHAQRMVTDGGLDRLLLLDAETKSARAQADETLAGIRLADAQLAEAAAKGAVLELIHRQVP